MDVTSQLGSQPGRREDRSLNGEGQVALPGDDADISAVASLFADHTRARVLLGMADSRALPASVLATEGAVSPQAASTQLRRRTGAG